MATETQNNDLTIPSTTEEKKFVRSTKKGNNRPQNKYVNNNKKKKFMMFYSKNLDTIERMSDHFLDTYRIQCTDEKTKKIHFDLILYDNIDSFINISVVNLDKFNLLRKPDCCHFYKLKYKKRFHVGVNNFGRFKHSVYSRSYLNKLWSDHNGNYLIKEFN